MSFTNKQWQVTFQLPGWGVNGNAGDCHEICDKVRSEALPKR